MVWVKSRSQSGSNNGIVDSVRSDGSGSHPMSYTNTDDIETVGGSYFDVGGGSTPFLTNGFRVNNNDSGNKNIGALISDYIVDFDKKTNEPKNKKPNHKHRLGKEGKRKPF